MKIISHRGNIEGKSEFENTQKQIYKAIDMGFDVEIDLWVIKNNLFLGHDNPETPCGLEFLHYNSDKLWIHAKNTQAVEYLSNRNELNWFWHDKDKMTLTSKGFIWSNIGEFFEDGITVCLDYENLPNYILGVCTDVPIKYLNAHDELR